MIGGGTIVVPDLTSGRLRPERAMLLTGAGLAGITRDGSRVTIGATTPVSELESLSGADRPVRSERRRQPRSARRAPSAATSAPDEGPRRPGATCRGPCWQSARRCVRRVPAARRPSRSRISFRIGKDRLLLDVSYEEPSAGAFAPLTGLTRTTTRRSPSRRREAKTARSGSRPAASPGHAVRLPSAEAKASDPGAAADAAAADVTFADDALASAWYRKRILPVLVRRALTQLEEV